MFSLFAASDFVGGVFVQSAKATLDQVQLSQNTAIDGAAIAAGTISCPASQPLWSQSILHISVPGGAYYLHLWCLLITAVGSSVVHLETCLLKDNVASERGGAVFVADTAKLSATSGIFDSNRGIDISLGMTISAVTRAHT